MPGYFGKGSVFMAIDPATAKLIAKIAQSVISEEKLRKAVIGIIVGIVAVVLLILAIPLFILSHPLQCLGMILGFGDTETAAVNDFKSQFDYVIPGNNDPLIKEGTIYLPLKGNVTVVREYEEGVHSGIDLFSTENSPVVAVADGTVVYAGDIDRVNTVKIRHTNEDGIEYFSVYRCLLFICVGENDVVTAGQQIGKRRRKYGQ